MSTGTSEALLASTRRSRSCSLISFVVRAVGVLGLAPCCVSEGLGLEGRRGWGPDGDGDGGRSGWGGAGGRVEVGFSTILSELRRSDGGGGGVGEGGAGREEEGGSAWSEGKFDRLARQGGSSSGTTASFTFSFPSSISSSNFHLPTLPLSSSSPSNRPSPNAPSTLLTHSARRRHVSPQNPSWSFPSTSMTIFPPVEEVMIFERGRG